MSQKPSEPLAAVLPVVPASAAEALAPHHLAHCDVWVFDLDNTLYPASCNLFVQVDRRIQQYIMSKFDAGPEEARRIQKSFFHEYGTTLNGLMLNHGVEPAAYLSYVHDIDVSPVTPSRSITRSACGTEPFV